MVDQAFVIRSISIPKRIQDRQEISNHGASQLLPMNRPVRKVRQLALSPSVQIKPMVKRRSQTFLIGEELPDIKGPVTFGKQLRGRIQIKNMNPGPGTYNPKY